MTPISLIPARANWFRSRWLAASMVLTLLGWLGVALLYPGLEMLVIWQVVLWLSFALSLRILCSLPLLNPVQGGLLLFYLWFGLGPLATLLAGAAWGVPNEARASIVFGLPALPFVAAGLPLYAVAARLMERSAARGNWHLKLFGAGQDRFRKETLLLFWLFGGTISLLLLLLPLMGIQGISFVSALGGKRTDVWWFGVLDTASVLLTFGNIIAVTSIIAPRLRVFRGLPLLGFTILIILLARSLSSGWKGQFLFPIAYLAIVYISERQRPPWLIVAALFAVFLFLLEPFVFKAREETRRRGATEPADRVEIFKDVLRDSLLEGLPSSDSSSRLFHVQAFFRGIFPLAGEVVRRSGLDSGPWHGSTLDVAFGGVVPRAFFPDKPDLNVGNFFAREIGVDLGLADPDSEDHSAAITIPIEVAGNVGLLAGLASFPILGLGWALLSALLLGPDPSRHPLNPYFVLLAVLIESPLFALLAQLRDLTIVIACVAAVWWLQRRRL